LKKCYAFHQIENSWVLIVKA